MSALFRAEIASLQRLVARQQQIADAATKALQRTLAGRKAAAAADRQAVIDTLAGAQKHLTSTEVAKRSGVSRQKCDRILEDLCDEKQATRRRRAVRREDGEGIRNPYKYRLTE